MPLCNYMYKVISSRNSFTSSSINLLTHKRVNGFTVNGVMLAMRPLPTDDDISLVYIAVTEQHSGESKVVSRVASKYNNRPVIQRGNHPCAMGVGWGSYKKNSC